MPITAGISVVTTRKIFGENGGEELDRRCKSK
jgi:hypothetical protein